MTDAKAGEAELKSLRKQIDNLDADIQKLISDRAECARRVAEVKQASLKNSQEAPVFYRPEREAQVLRRVMARNEGPVPDEEMARIFREIMSVCLALEEPLRVAFLGPEGTFTQAAALKHFGHSVRSAPLGSVDDVFREVEAGAAHYGIVPVENSTEGMVNSTLDSFMNSPLKICGEVELRIHHHILARADVELDQITHIFSHQQSLAQCRQWLNNNLFKAERVSVSSNAEAARMVAESEPGEQVAAIAGDLSVERYGLSKLAEKIEDQPDNTTRFLIIGNQDVPASGQDKTTILVSTRNKPGALFQLLNPFQREGISLSRIETRPSRSGTWAYVFFIDCEGHLEAPALKQVLDEIREEVVELKVLGSYPVAVL